MNFKQAYKDITVVEYNILSKGNEKKEIKMGGGHKLYKIEKKTQQNPQIRKNFIMLDSMLVYE